MRYGTWGAGLVAYIDPHVKATLYYDHVRNEKTALPGYTTDRKDDVFTFRLQYRF